MNRYRDYNTYLRKIFGERVQKIPLDAGLGCPNRDGNLSTKGCIFCDRRGSGTGNFIEKGLSIDDQIVRAKDFIRKRYGARKFLAYFQSFTNTHASTVRLKALYDRALAHEGMVGLSVGTRPDCVNGNTLELLASYQDDYLVWIEYGLQSAHDPTLDLLNRGHDAACFAESVTMTHAYGINVCAHVILGLPGEDREMMLETARFLAGLPVKGVKIHLLYVVRGTPLAEMYARGEFVCLEREEYAERVVDFLERLPGDVVIQRITGDPVGPELVAPSWAIHKNTNLKSISETLQRRNTWQGRLCKESTAGS